MRVFVTGGTGHSGSYIIPELIAAGHEVTGLARSDTAAAAVSALGAKVRRGSLEDPRRERLLQRHPSCQRPGQTGLNQFHRSGVWPAP
jgi:nucleoside-diphosphate-sugar epimerase